MKATSIATVAALLIAVGIPQSFAAEDAPRREKEFKGIELYARFDKDKNQWRFGLLPGTNRNKQADEVDESMTLTGLDALLAERKPGLARRSW